MRHASCIFHTAIYVKLPPLAFFRPGDQVTSVEDLAADAIV